MRHTHTPALGCRLPQLWACLVPASLLGSRFRATLTQCSCHTQSVPLAPPPKSSQQYMTVKRRSSICSLHDVSQPAGFNIPIAFVWNVVGLVCLTRLVTSIQNFPVPVSPTVCYLGRQHAECVARRGKSEHSCICKANVMQTATVANMNTALADNTTWLPVSIHVATV